MTAKKARQSDDLDLDTVASAVWWLACANRDLAWAMRVSGWWRRWERNIALTSAQDKIDTAYSRMLEMLGARRQLDPPDLGAREGRDGK